MIDHSAILYRYDKKYRFVLTSEVVFYLGPEFPVVEKRQDFCDAAGRQWLRMEGRCLWISPQYAWNGCSPRPLGRWGIWWLGTPDCSATIQASLPHDVLYQFLDDPGFPFTRSQCDLVFLRVMQSKRFPLALAYWAAVRTCGGIDRALTKGSA
jgi:hypothetical protein